MQLSFRDVLPPLVVRAGSLIVNNTRQVSTYDEARALCGEGYAAEELLRVVVEKTHNLVLNLKQATTFSMDEATARMIFAFGFMSGQFAASKEVRVADFGGACGAHFFTTDSYIGERFNFSWAVIETPGMVRVARERITHPKLGFFSRVGEAVEYLGGIDIVFSSGAVQYAPDPYNTVEELVGVGARFLYLTRLGLTKADTGKFLAHTSWLSAHGTGGLPHGIRNRRLSCPITLMSRKQLESLLRIQYKVVMGFAQNPVLHRLRSETIMGYEYLAEHL